MEKLKKAKITISVAHISQLKHLWNQSKGEKSEKKRRRKQQQQNQKEYIWLTSHHEGSQFCRTGTP